MSNADVNDEFQFSLWDELAGAIARASASDERTLQTAIGASGLGTPCNRKLAYRLAELPAVNVSENAESVASLITAAKWRAQVGKAVHLWLADVMAAINAKELASPMHGKGATCKVPYCEPDGGVHTPRYLVEFETPIGTIGGQAKDGHIDVYDRLKKTVIDWKIVGPKSLKDKKALCHRTEDPHPGDEYRVQAHTYAAGLARGLGLKVERVACVFLPMNGELRDGFAWSEPFNPQIRADAFKRARAIFDAMAVHGDDGKLTPEGVEELLPKLKTVNDYCHSCDWFKPGVEKASVQGCPGDKSLFVDMGTNDVDSVLG